LREVGPPPATWLQANPQPEIVPLICHGNVDHVARSIPATTAAVLDSDMTTQPCAPASASGVFHGGTAAMRPPSNYVQLVAFPVDSDSTLPELAPALSPSGDSGFAASPRSLPDGFPLTVNRRHHDLPSDLIFEYVDDKLRELVRYVFIMVSSCGNFCSFLINYVVASIVLSRPCFVGVSS